jgi:hypothetical protein
LDPVFQLDGAYDLHVHAGPDLFERVADDVETASRYAAAGMAGMAVKAHLESTASRAYHVNSLLHDRGVDSFRYIGGICLNYPVGGINPAAVDACLRSGGRIVWMPSGHSRFHGEIKGTLGNWGYGDMKLYTPPDARGISVFDDAGELTPETRDVVAMVRDHHAVLATSHLSPPEILALSAFAQPLGAKIVVTHLRWTPEYDLALGEAAVANGATIEIAASTVGGYENRCSLAEAVQITRTLGPRHVVISSDAGSPRYPVPAELLRAFGENLSQAGVAASDLRQMMVDNPAALIAA